MTQGEEHRTALSRSNSPRFGEKPTGLFASLRRREASAFGNSLGGHHARRFVSGYL